MEITTLVVGPLATNCYIVADAKTGEACVIDPGADPSRIRDIVRKKGLDPKFVIITHGHGDHIGANTGLGLPVYIHRLDADFLTDPGKNLSKMFMMGITSPKAAKILEDGDIIPLGSIRLKVLHTPGHTPGSVSIAADGVIFTGDALFAGSIGRTDFEYGDEGQLIQSIRDKLLACSDDTVIYPGHGPSSTIGEERATNPFLT